MPVAIACQNLSKSYSSRALFRGISFALDDRERLGLIGPNGSGKSTLLKILSGMVDPDEGTVTPKKYLNIAYLAQENIYAPGLTAAEVVAQSLQGLPLDEAQRATKVEVALSRVGFDTGQIDVAQLSGGWRKRLALAAELVREPDFLLLDEPTNHLDLSGVLWLENLLKSASFGYVVVTHDRNFLENITDRMMELNPMYRDGLLSVKGKYSAFLTARQELVLAQGNQEDALASKVRREIAWLSRGARARQTKAQGRIRAAAKLMEDFEEVKFRNTQTASVDIDFNASGRKTKELLVCKDVEKSLGGKLLFSNLNLTLHSGKKLGLLGTNGSGKTTLLKILAGQMQPDQGTIKRAHDLKVVWFDQNREQLDKDVSLREALCPSSGSSLSGSISDSVVYNGRSIHVASWSRRFLFRPDQLNMPVSYLSGGEQARILIARLMLQPADILILDEPTNDLDIQTLEVLEESLNEFPGAVVLVTHDRFMIDTVSTEIVALDGSGGVEFFADYTQWEDNRLRQSANVAKRSVSEKVSLARTGQAKTCSAVRDAGQARADGLRDCSPLSTGEKKQLETLPEKIEAAETCAAEIRQQMEDPDVASDHVKLHEYMNRLAEAESAVSELYLRWEDLESRRQLT